MAEDTAAKAAPSGGDHDRVAMLSVAKDGSFDQHDPEIIGDKEFAQEATRKQFAENAVSAADSARLADEAAAGAAEEVGQDPEIAARQKEHEKLEKSAEKAADKAVDALYKG
jgi:hypothetical protein